MTTTAMTPRQIIDQLEGTVSNLPVSIEQDDPNGGVLRPWVRGLPLRYQGVLLTAIRGCDGAGKEDDSKYLSRMIRRATMNPADPRETSNSRGFFGFSEIGLLNSVRAFFHSLDQYPLHYVMHLMHASEVIAYCCPDLRFADFFDLIYRLFCHTMHVMPEGRTRLEERLTSDRVAAGTTEENF